MKTFTNEQYGALQAQATQILADVAQGKSTREIMAQIYVDNLDEKTMAQGEIIAEAILRGVKGFDADYKAAQEDVDGFIAKFMDSVAKDKSIIECCAYWMQLTAALSAATVQMNDEGADREAILAQISELHISEEEATEAREKELRAQAADAIRNSGVMLSALMQQANALEQMAQADKAAGLLIDLGNREIEYRAIIAMLAYTKIKSGEYEEIPADMTAQQVAAIVCAQAEQVRIMDAVSKGHLATDVAALLLSVLGIVVLAHVFYALGTIGIAFALAAFPMILAIPAVLMVVLGVFSLCKSAMEKWGEVSKSTVNAVVVGVKSVFKGMKAVAIFVKDNVIGNLVKAAAGALQNLMTSVQGERQAETATQS